MPDSVAIGAAIPMPKPIIIGHRGSPKQAPENTFASIRKGIECGATHIELDVRMTKDDVPVIFHDQKLNRMTNGSGFLSQVELSALKELKVKRKENIPTLEEVLEEFKGKCGLVLDIKVRNSILPAYKLVKKRDGVSEIFSYLR